MMCKTVCREEPAPLRRFGRVVAGALSLAVFAAIGPGPAGSQEPIAIGVDAAYPPYMYAAAGQPAGLYVDLIGAVFERMGLPITIEAMPWPEAVERIDRAESGLGGAYKNDVRLEKYDYSEAILEETLMVYVRSGDEFPFDGLDDLEGRLVGVNSGWSYGQAFDDARANGIITAEEAASDTTNLMKLRDGQIDAAIVDSLAAHIIITGHDDLKEAIVALPNPMATNKGYLAFNKQAGNRLLLEDFNHVLSAMKTDGSFDSVFLSSVEKNAVVSAE